MGTILLWCYVSLLTQRLRWQTAVVQIAKGERESYLDVAIFMHTTEFSIFFDVCPCAEQAYLICYPACWRCMWKCKYCINEMLDPAQTCISLVVFQDWSLIFVSLEYFLWRKHNSSELNVQLKDFLNSNGLKWSLSLIPISILLSSAEVFLYLYKANFLWPDRNFFKVILLHVLTK